MRVRCATSVRAPSRRPNRQELQGRAPRSLLSSPSFGRRRSRPRRCRPHEGTAAERVTHPWLDLDNALIDGHSRHSSIIREIRHAGLRSRVESCGSCGVAEELMMASLHKPLEASVVATTSTCEQEVVAATGNSNRTSPHLRVSALTCSSAALCGQLRTAGCVQGLVASCVAAARAVRWDEQRAQVQARETHIACARPKPEAERVQGGKHDAAQEKRACGHRAQGRLGEKLRAALRARRTCHMRAWPACGWVVAPAHG